ASLPPQQPVPDQVRPGVADRATTHAVPAHAYPAVELPPGVKPEMTNAKRFNLDYDVTSVGPNGLADVELWATTDGGRRWDRWGKDPDRTSPFDVKVERDGVYGFRVVVV